MVRGGGPGSAVCARSRGVVWLVWGGGVAGPGGGIPACTEADPLPPVNRMNDRQV